MVLCQLASIPLFSVRGESGKFIAECPNIVGCLTQGDTIDEALANIREAIELCLEDMRERGEDWPAPASAFLSEVAVEV